MRVTTPIADMNITIDQLRVEDGTLVMENAKEDGIRTRAVMEPSDVRVLFRAILRPSVIWFALTCIFKQHKRGSSAAAKPRADHPTSNPW